MALPAIAGNTILAQDLYPLCQPSGLQENGKYFLAGPVYASGAVVSAYIPSQSRNATPVSVTAPDSDTPHTGGMTASPSTGQLTSSGFQVFSLSTTGPNLNARAGGPYTIQYALFLALTSLTVLATVLGHLPHLL